MRSIDVHLGRIGIFIPQDIASIFDHHTLHTQTDTECRHIVLTGIFQCYEFSLDTSLSETGSDNKAVHRREFLFDIAFGQLLGMDILQIELTIVIGSRLEQSLIDRFICVLQLDIFSYESYAYRIFGILHVCQEFPPGFQLGSRTYFHPRFSQNDFIEFLLLHFQRHLINRRYIDGLNDGIGFDITEQRYFTTQIDTQLMLGTQHENIRLNTDFLQLLYRVLGRLGLQLFGGGNKRNIGKMYA